MDIRTISILGSTGSIGTQALDVARSLNYRVEALTAGSNIALLEKQVREFMPRYVAVRDEGAALKFREMVSDLPVEVLSGDEGVCEAAAGRDADIVLNAVVGIAGLRPTLSALRAKKDVALANKETLVTAGEIVMRTARENGVKILPVDSEHSAIFQSLNSSGRPEKELKRIILTASGGPFYGKNRAQLGAVTPAQALRHPNWSMGAKITVDSATLMNKGLELIEACRLFGVTPAQVMIVVQRESVIHSAVEFCDNAVIAQLGVPDMRLPIQYALTYPDRVQSSVQPLDLFAIGSISFGKPDPDTFKCLKVCIEAAQKGGLYTAAVNGANEQAVELFLHGKIGFNDIGDLVESAAEIKLPDRMTVDTVFETDAMARRHVLEEVFGPNGSVQEDYRV